MSKMVFINLPVIDLARATRFYQAIGCTRNPQFSDDNAACMVWSDTINFMLLTRDFFASFAPGPVADASQAVGVLIALSQDSREAVDDVTRAAGEAGGKADVRAPQDMGFMYQRSFTDPDGHVFEPAWMDMSAGPAS